MAKGGPRRGIACFKARNWEPALDRDLIDDATWELIAPFLPLERGRNCRPSIDNRRVLEGIFRVVQTGAPWRDLPERSGVGTRSGDAPPAGATRVSARPSSMRSPCRAPASPASRISAGEVPARPR
ncbi:MAG: transposase [Pikeienuella sp.]